jgi:hypothetical protein
MGTVDAYVLTSCALLCSVKHITVSLLWILFLVPASTTPQRLLLSALRTLLFSSTFLSSPLVATCVHHFAHTVLH